MSFHGGTDRVTTAIIWMSRKEGLNRLRVHDYIACCVPFGLFFGRLCQFRERRTVGQRRLMYPGRSSSQPGDIPRHPSQLYESALEGCRAIPDPLACLLE